MKRSIAMLLVFVLLTAMFPAVSAATAAAPEQSLVLNKVDPTITLELPALQAVATDRREAELHYSSGWQNMVVPTFDMYGMTVLTGETMRLRCYISHANSDSETVVMVYKGHYSELDENSELVGAVQLPRGAGSWSAEWDTTGLKAGDYTVYYAIVNPDYEILYASMADVYLSDVEIPLDHIGFYIMELGRETDTLYLYEGNDSMMSIHPVRYPYHTTDRRHITIKSVYSGTISGSGNFFGESGMRTDTYAGHHYMCAYIDVNGYSSYLTYLNIIVEELNEKHVKISPEQGYLNICPGVDYPIDVQIPADMTMEDMLIQTSIPGLLEAFAVDGQLYVRTLVDYSSLNQLIIASADSFDVKGFYIRDHFYTNELVRPTCTEDGYRASVCRHCGDVESIEVLPATGHVPQGKTVITEPTATKDGVAIGKCVTCKEEVEYPISRIFTDTQPDWFYSDALDYCYENGIINGLTATTFGPGATLNRAQLVTMLYRHAGAPEVEGESTFTDVPAGQFYTNAVIWASTNGIVNGYEDGSFRPGKEITRQEIVTMLHRYVVSLGKDNGERSDLAAFTDLDQLMGYADDAMQWAVANGVINGISETQLGPQQSANRAQTVTILYRIITGTLGE